MAKLQFTTRALRDLRKLPAHVRREIELTLDQLIEDPMSGGRLHGNWKGSWKLRWGDYRIIYRIADGDTVVIRYVRHRRDAYRK